MNKLAISTYLRSLFHLPAPPKPADRLSGHPCDYVVLSDDISPDQTLDTRSDWAEVALNSYQDAAGSTGDDCQDVIELIADLLHLLDDVYLDGAADALGTNLSQYVLSKARRTYTHDLVGALS